MVGPAEPQDDTPRPRFRERYAVVYDVNGPHVRLGVGWGVLVAASLARHQLRPYGTAILFSIAAAWAAMEVVDAWADRHPAGDARVAAAGAAAMTMAAVVGVRVLGVVVLGFVALALATGMVRSAREPILSSAGQMVLAGIAAGGVGASIVLTLRYDISAAIVLLVLVGVYEASDYVVGSGASSALEGPLAGWISMGVVTFIVVVAKVPPFRGGKAWPYVAFAGLAIPVGQLVASALLPSAATKAPALRRLDSFLLLGPAWAILIGHYLTTH